MVNIISVKHIEKSEIPDEASCWVDYFAMIYLDFGRILRALLSIGKNLANEQIDN